MWVSCLTKLLRKGPSISPWHQKDSFGGDYNCVAHHDFLLYKKNICRHLQHVGMFKLIKVKHRLISDNIRRVHLGVVYPISYIQWWSQHHAGFLI